MPFEEYNTETTRWDTKDILKFPILESVWGLHFAMCWINKHIKSN